MLSRLSKHIEKITDKGQNCILNLLDNIQKCSTFNCNAALILLDFKKAFDRLSHDLIISALDFSNFGEKMIQTARAEAALLSPRISVETSLIKLILSPCLERVTSNTVGGENDEIFDEIWLPTI